MSALREQWERDGRPCAERQPEEQNTADGVAYDDAVGTTLWRTPCEDSPVKAEVRLAAPQAG
eukprot:11550956-Prorocentrum_lima.AAC.1